MYNIFIVDIIQKHILFHLINKQSIEKQRVARHRPTILVKAILRRIAKKVRRLEDCDMCLRCYQEQINSDKSSRFVTSNDKTFYLLVTARFPEECRSKIETYEQFVTMKFFRNITTCEGDKIL